MPRLRVALSGPGPVENVAWNADFALTGTITSLATLQTIATALRTSLAADAAFKAGFCNDTQITDVKLLYYPAFSGLASLVAESAGAGILGTTPAVHPPQICVVASLRSNLAGRSFRGRQYWPYRGSGVSSAGSTAGGGQTIVALAAQALKNDVVAACTASSIGAAWGVYSPKLSLMTPIVDVLVGSQCDTQRRRNVNRDETYAVSPVTVTTIVVPDEDAKDAVDAVIAQFLNSPINLADGVAAAETLAAVVSAIEE